MEPRGGGRQANGGGTASWIGREALSIGFEAASIGLGAPEIARAPRILVLEDDREVQSLVRSMLDTRGLGCTTAGTVGQARQLLREGSYDIMLVDVHLPDGLGFSCLEEAPGSGAPVVVVMTGSSDIQTAVRAIRDGASDIITKPFSVEQFRERMDAAVEEWRLRERLRRSAQALETLVRLKTDELSRTSHHVDEVHDAAVAALVAALNLKDHETADHCARVSLNSVTLGRLLSLSEFELRNLKWGAYLHDVGKIGIPEPILLKKAPLLPAERRVMERHPSMGHAMIRDIEFLRFAADVVLCHHESYDGAGYPRGLRGEEIPLPARIFSIMDTLDAMTSDRPYRSALPLSEVVEELRGMTGSRFDPEIIEAFMEVGREAWHIQGVTTVHNRTEERRAAWKRQRS